MTNQMQLGYGSTYLATFTDEQLLNEYNYMSEVLLARQQLQGHLEQEIHRRMEERGATSIPSDGPA